MIIPLILILAYPCFFLLGKIAGLHWAKKQVHQLLAAEMDKNEKLNHIRPAIEGCKHIDPDDGTCTHPDAVMAECHYGAPCPTRDEIFEENAMLRKEIKAFIDDFKMNFVLDDGQIVDDPDSLLEEFYIRFREIIKTIEESEG